MELFVHAVSSSALTWMVFLVSLVVMEIFWSICIGLSDARMKAVCFSPIFTLFQTS